MKVRWRCERKRKGRDFTNVCCVMRVQGRLPIQLEIIPMYRG